METPNKKVSHEAENDEMKVTPFTFRIYLRDSPDDYIASLREWFRSLPSKEILVDEEE